MKIQVAIDCGEVFSLCIMGETAMILSIIDKITPDIKDLETLEYLMEKEKNLAKGKAK